MDPQLERLERIGDLRAIWNSEEKDFTPWLAKNLDLLEKTLGVELELEAKEKPVGPFRADIYCRETDPEGRKVLVENQLDPTNHTHLGQLLTYAAGLDAVIIVWIAARIRDEHRTALDWLNRITDENFHFFGLEIELWRIGDSALAPKLNIISRPKNWSKSFPKTPKALSETQRMQVDYWAAFQDVLNKAGGSVSARPTPQPQNCMGYGVGSGDCGVDAVMNTGEKRVQVRIRIWGSNAKRIFGLLKRQKKAIEQDLGFRLTWDKRPDKQTSFILSNRENTDPKEKSGWRQQHEWLTHRLNKMHDVFAPRIKDLDLND